MWYYKDPGKDPGFDKYMTLCFVGPLVEVNFVKLNDDPPQRQTLSFVWPDNTYKDMRLLKQALQNHFCSVFHERRVNKDHLEFTCKADISMDKVLAYCSGFRAGRKTI